MKLDDGARWPLAAAAMVVAAACSTGGGSPSAEALTPVKLQLQWFPQAQFAGYFAAAGPGLLQGRRVST